MLIHTARSSRSSSSPAAASSRASQLCSLLLLLLMLLVCLVSLSSAQTVTEVITRTTGSASLNRPTRTAAPAASDATTTRSTPAVTSTTIPDLPLSGPQVPFLLQKPIPAQYDDLSRKVVSRMKDVYFTGCPADQVNYVDPTLRINISAVYTQFDPVLGSSNHLADQTSYSSGVLRIVAVGATDSVGRTVNTNVAPQLLSTLSVETQFLTFSVFGNDSYLCDSLYPVAPDPNGTVINGVVIQPAGCLYGPGQVSLGVGIPLNDTYTLGTLWTRIRLSDTSSPPLDIACIEVYANPYDREKWYWKLIFWFPVALAIGFLVVIALARTFCAITSRARAFKNKAREGSQPNIIKDTIAPTLVSALSGQKLALSAALLRFATPGCWDIIMHTQFVAAISMVAVRWPEFSYAFFKQASWSTLTGNVTIIRPAEFDAQSDLLYTNASLPSGDIDAQFSNASSPLYMNQQAPNRFMNLDGARAGMDAYAHAVGLRPRDLFGTCLSIWLLIVAAIVGLSLLAWLVDSFHDTFLRLQKRREDGYSLDVADAPSAAETKEVVDADDDRPRSSISRRGGYRFLGVGGKRLLGSSDNTFHLRMLHGNILRAVFLFHLPITIFTTFQMANADIFSATSVGLAGLAFAFLSVLAPFYVAFSISRAPTAKLYDSIDTLAAFGPVYNNYSPGSQLFCIVDFARTLILGVVIGAGQGNGSAQAIIILVFEIMFALACGLWLPWGEGAMMGPVSFVVNVLRIFTAVLVLLLSPLVDFGREPNGWLTYVILLIQGIVYVCAALILVVKLVEGLVRLLGRASFDERASTRLSGLGGAVRKIRKRKEGKLQLSKNGNKKRLSQTRQPLNRSASSNTQTIMLNALGKDGSTGENTPAVPSSPRRMSTPLPSTMSTNRMPMHSRQASYASYLDSQLQGRRSPADMLADGNGPYSTYLRGDPHDEGFIMAALPSTVASGRAVSPPPQLHQWNGRQSPPLPAPQSGFVRMSGGRATDAAPYQALQGRTQSSQLPRPLSSGSIERMSPTQQFQSLPFQRRPRPQSQIAAVDSYFDPRRQSMPPANQDDGIGLSSTEAAARNATIRRYSQGAQLRASQSIAGMMAVDEEGQPIEPASKKPNGKFWKRGGARSDSDSDDDDDDNGAYAYGADNAAFRSRGGWRGLNKMSAAMSSLAARLGSGKPNGAVAEEGDNSLEPPASEAEGSGTRQGHGGFEVVRPQRPRRSSAAADRALDSTALAAASAGAVAGSMTHPSPTPTAVQPASSAEAIGARPDSRRAVASAADAYSMPAYESQQRALLDELDDSSGTLPPGAADQALLLPSRSSNRPSSAILSSSASRPAAVNEDMFWVSSSSPSASRPQSYAASRPVSASSSRMMSAAATALSTTASKRDSRQQVSTSSSKGRIAEPMQAEVVNAAAEDSSSAEGFATPPAGMVDASEPSMFDADGRLVSSAINFDRAPTHASAAASTGPMQRSTGPDGGTPQVWDAAQAYQ
ncbi:integral membrane protein [Pseudozyma hubeiensis SY62]|uniref:Integral membrane protein n=1 Tax=Pseudozyma hubeiensis (strain SY62) TaxID=1305764 RepID=R9P4X6_PSEHS|nr:integral membrane protein [Pseudozyma hubeiensis SY62]GAC96401.1 integral membrane protein [Pseudozyma hubeiensis SY62]